MVPKVVSVSRLTPYVLSRAPAWRPCSEASCPTKQPQEELSPHVWWVSQSQSQGHGEEFLKSSTAYLEYYNNHQVITQDSELCSQSCLHIRII